MAAPSPAATSSVTGSSDAAGRDASRSGKELVVPGRDAKQRDQSSYPGGKSGAGIFQRLINLIPPHRVFVSAFAGRCGVARHIRSAEHTIIIDADEHVCQWWSNWRRSPAGRDVEIHHADGIEWMRYRFGTTRYRDADSCDSRGRRDIQRHRPTMHRDAAEYFVFCDPPYVLSERSHGKQYAHEMDDNDHRRLVSVVDAIDSRSTAVLLCGYRSQIYAALDPWRTIDHQVPTRGGLQDERIWLNYPRPDRLHDYRFIGNCRRSRERIRRRQKNWLSQLNAMSDRERAAMLEVLQNGT